MTVNPSEVAEEYRSSLVDLTVNSKPLITMLTMLAEENKDHASVIIGVIEDQILKAPSNQKLPVMYLIDSIVKNVGDHYTRGFANNLVKTFGSTFEKVDERTRKKLYELRQTWNDVFPGSRLYMMDVKVNQADPAWPITSQQPPGTIHINPKMINKKMIKSEQAPTTRSSGGKSQFQEITKKKEELLDIEKKKLAMMKKQLEIQAVPKEKPSIPEAPVEPTPTGSKERRAEFLRSYKIKKKTGPEKSEIKGVANIYVDPRRMNQVQLPPTAPAIVSPRDPRLTSATPATPDSPVSPRDPRLASTAPTAQESSPISDSSTERVTRTSRPPKRPDPRLEKSGEKEKEKDKDKDSSHKKKEKDKDDREKRKKEKDKDKDKDKEKNKDKEKSSRKSSNISSLEKLSSRSTIVSHREKDKKDKESSLISSSTNTVVPPVDPVVVPSNLLSPPPGIKPLISEEESSTVFNKHKSNRGRKQHVRTRRSESPDEATVDTTSTLGSSSSPNSNKKRNRSQEDSESGDSDDYQANKPNPAAYHNKKVRKGEVSSSSPAMVLLPTNTSGDTDCGADVDLRQLTPTGKRSAQSQHDENTTPPKKEKLHFEEEQKEAQDPFGLFSGQDVDLRQILAPPNMGPLVPPPGPPELPAVFKGVVDQDLRPSSNMTSQDSLMASINTEEIQVGHLPNLGEDGVSPTGVVSQLAAVMDMDSAERKQSFNSPHAAKWKQFREKNPEFKEYQRQASTSESDRSFPLEGVDEESTPGTPFPGPGRGRGQFRTHSDHRTKRSSTERKRLMYEDEEEGDSSPANNEATKRNYQVIVSQAEEQMQRGEITMSQYNQLLQTVVSLVEQDKIKEARAENNQPYHGDVPGPESDDGGLPPMHLAPEMARGRGGPYMDRGRGFGRGGRLDIDGATPGGPTVHIGPPGGPVGRGGRGIPMDREGHEGMRGHPRMRGRGDRGGNYMNEPVFDQDYECASEPELPEPSKEDIRFATDNIKNQCNIEIDKIMREIHIYGTTAIALMERDDPRELTFEDGLARIVFEGGKFVLPMRIGQPYKEFKIDGEPHRIRLGVPTRELFLDGVGYQCFFGNPGKPITILLAGKRRNIALNGMAPNVKIGSVRNIEYCAGKTEMVINAKKVVFLNLDGRPQKFTIDGKIFIIRFIDKLRSVNINGTVFPVEFGGKPISINVKGFRKYLSFQPLPKGIIPGQVSLRNMEGEPPIPHGRAKRHSPTRTEGPPAGIVPPGHPLHPPPPPPTGVVPGPHPPGPLVPHPPGPPVPHPPGPPGIPVSGMPPSQPIQPGPPVPHPSGVMQQLGPHGMPLPGPPHILPGPPMPPPWLPPHTNVPPPGFDNTKAPPTVVAGGQHIPPGVNMSYNTNVPPPVAPAQAVATPLDIGNLLAGLKKAGLIGTKKEKGKDEADEKRLAEEEHLKEEENKIPIELMFDSENLRKRRSYLIHGLYNGMQCSSCGLRYPPEQTVQYSHHLDWHFRQNKRQQESTKKANARRFYFSIEDWLQYEEIEDVDERAPSKFELDGLEEPLDTSDSEIPSIAIDESDESLSSCFVCHDVFNKFYHQDTEEWRYHNATQVEGVNYHPSCHEDLVSAQLAEEKAKEEKEMAEAAAAEEAAAAAALAAEAEGDKENSEAKEGDKENSEAKEGEKVNSEANEADKENSEANEADKENSEANEADKESSVAKKADKENSEAKEGGAENSEETIEKDALPTENGIPNKDITDENSAEDNMSTENGDNVESSTGENVEEANNAFQMVRIKEEPMDQSSIPDSSKTLPGGIAIKEEPGVLKVKEEPQDIPVDDEDGYCLVDDTDENLDESWLATTMTAVVPTETNMTSTIDGNMEMSTAEPAAAPASVPRIKISISKPSININNNNNNNNNDNTNDKGGVNNSLPEGGDDFVAPAFTVDLAAKPHFRGVELEDMPLQCRGLELSGLCSIM